MWYNNMGSTLDHLVVHTRSMQEKTAFVGLIPLGVVLASLLKIQSASSSETIFCDDSPNIEQTLKHTNTTCDTARSEEKSVRISHWLRLTEERHNTFDIL